VITHLRRRKKKLLWNSSQKRRVRICERNNYADTRVSEEGREGGSSDAGEEIPLQSVEKTIVRQTVPLQPMEVNSGADPMLEQVDAPKGGCDSMGNLCSSKLLAAPVDAWGENLMLE